MESIKKNWVLLLAILAGFAGLFYIGKGLKRKPTGEYITVTGMAEKSFNSDQIQFSIYYNCLKNESKEAYIKIKSDAQLVMNYLKNKGVTDAEIIPAAITVEKSYAYEENENGRSRQVFKGYQASQNITLKSARIAELEVIARDAIELIEKGIDVSISNPEYSYSKLSEMKLDLIEKAAADAKARAERIAKATGASLGTLKKSNMGVFQITGENESEAYTAGGAFNTSSKAKKARITVYAAYCAD